jgi:bacteriorhodopsin
MEQTLQIVETVSSVSSNTPSDFSLVYNMLSLTVAAMGAATVFFFLSRGSVLPKYRPALIVSGLVTLIACYHYARIFLSWDAAYASGNMGSFNDAYRYVDWLLTVPLLLIELILVMRLSQDETVSKSFKLGGAAALMIILGYPGELATDNMAKGIWGALSTIPFLYILYVLFVELSRASKTQPVQVGKDLNGLRWLLLATWGVYPISYMFPMFGLNGADAFVYRQVGYSVADVLAKCLFALLIFKIARIKSMDDSPEFAEAEMKEAPSSK